MKSSFSYRPEIDGLRTIAVLSVIFYHLNINVYGKNVVPGGFVGVDVFFVISGFLISRIIIDSVKINEFSFLDFYERRARRILPVLLLVMTCSIPVAWRFLLPTDFVDLCIQIISGIFSVSNIYFWLEDPYWAADSSLKPFLHTWSLGVEEQFYFFMPLFLICVFKANLNLKLCLTILLILSLSSAQWASNAFPQAAFYLLPFRAWELILGALLATITFKQQYLASFTKYLPTLGLCLIVFSIFWFDKDTRHPSIVTLVPVLGTALIILFANDSDPATMLLGTRPFIFVGLISYGLYVWHFPLFAFANVAGFFDHLHIKLLLILVVFLFSTFSYYSFERNFRDFEKIPTTRFWFITISWVAVISAFSIYGLSGGYKDRLPALINQPTKPEKIPNHQWFESKSRKGRIILVGDSHTDALAPTLLTWATTNGYDFMNSSVSGCQLLYGAQRVRKSDLRPRENCTIEQQEKRIAHILDSPPSIVIFGGRLPLILEEDRFDNKEGQYEGLMNDFIQNESNSLATKVQRQGFIRSKYQETVELIEKSGHSVILIYPIPEVGWHVPKTLQKRIDGNYYNARDIVLENPLTTSYDVFLERSFSAYNLLDSITGKNIYRVFPESIFCNKSFSGRCVTHDQENAYYRDDDHLSDFGAYLLVTEISKTIKAM